MPHLAGLWLITFFSWRAGKLTSRFGERKHYVIVLYQPWNSSEKKSKQRIKVGGEVISAECFDYQQQNSAKNGCWRDFWKTSASWIRLRRKFCHTECLTSLLQRPKTFFVTIKAGKVDELNNTEHGCYVMWSYNKQLVDPF